MKLPLCHLELQLVLRWHFRCTPSADTSTWDISPSQNPPLSSCCRGLWCPCHLAPEGPQCHPAHCHTCELVQHSAQCESMGRCATSRQALESWPNEGKLQWHRLGEEVEHVQRSEDVQGLEAREQRHAVLGYWGLCQQHGVSYIDKSHNLGLRGSSAHSEVSDGICGKGGPGPVSVQVVLLGYPTQVSV